LKPEPYLPVSYLEANAAAMPEAPAVIDPERNLTFGQLLDAVRGGASALREQGVARGAVVAVQLPNVWEHVVLELAIPALEAVVMPLPLTLGEAELTETLRRSGAALVVTGKGGAALAVARRLGIHTVAADAVCDGRSGEGFSMPRADAARVVEIALTSGTTGLPKLASLTAGLKQATFEGFTARLGVGAGDRILAMSPLMQGIGGMCLLCLRKGAALVMLREPRFTAEHTLHVAAKTEATHLVGVPTNVIRMLDSPVLEPAKLNARVTAVAGAPMPPDVARRWEEKTGSKVCIFYGSMDAGQLAVGSPDDPADKRWNSVGRPHDSCEAIICDPEGRPLPVGEIGEVCMRGPTVQERYWAESSGPLAPDGWAHMGDLGFLDGDGYLHIVGRSKDIVIRGGTNINPYEVEAILREHPDIGDVCVIGRPDRELGERVMAFVVARAGRPVDVHDFLSKRGVAHYKWPEFVEVVAEIPLSGPGKVNRRELRERAESMAC
jgi:acyl-CoA synthetase (AMP-forming)/AMP-acid ligase II